VSEIDYSNAVSIGGTAIPALTTRTATTTVELRSGQSFAIAGMLQAINTRNITQLPWVGDVPVLGTLFRSAGYQKSETDLVIIVTPTLVQPAAPGARLATPFDNTVPSNDVDFFLFGKTELRKKYTDYVATGGDIQGPYGHMIGVLQGPNVTGLQK
jgi:pilus assembly protein CpaC